MAMKMPMIISCNMMNCAYNKDETCHAMAITIGASSPVCDTFIERAEKAGAMDMVGSVGACKVANCKFNESLECMAEDGIRMGMHTDHAECDTFMSM